jgi:hypothetical protein
MLTLNTLEKPMDDKGPIAKADIPARIKNFKSKMGRIGNFS